MSPVDAARCWAITWHEAWEAQDIEVIVALYAPDALLSTEKSHIEVAKVYELT